jgi:hypothetical protein
MWRPESEIPICRISHARADNQRSPGGGEGWISHLSSALEEELRLRPWLEELRHRLGFHCIVAMEMDTTVPPAPLKPREGLCAVTYVLVITPSYLTSQWCQEELAAISERAAQWPGNVFQVTPFPLDARDDRRIPINLQRAKYYRFWQRLENGDIRRYQPAGGIEGRDFYETVKELASDIERFLSGLLDVLRRFEIHGVTDLIRQALAAHLDGVGLNPPRPYKYHVFISYTSREGGFPPVADMVSVFVSALERCGIKSPPYFYDKKDIDQWSGDPAGLKPVLQCNIDASCSMIAIMTPPYSESPWCCWEWNYMTGLGGGGVWPAFWTRLNMMDRLRIKHNLRGARISPHDVYLDEGWRRFKDFIAYHRSRLSAAVEQRLQRFYKEGKKLEFKDVAELEQITLREIGCIEPEMETYARRLLAHVHEIGDFIRLGYERAASRSPLGPS